MFPLRRTLCLLATLVGFAISANAAAPVWRVTNARGQELYLAGSMHALRSVDYPLPAEFNRAFEASSRLSFEVEPDTLRRSSESMVRAGKYPAGDSLRSHVDPRTYEYVQRVFKLLHVPEDEYAHYRPWLLSFLLESGGMKGLSQSLGVEEFLTSRARANRKPTGGLESANEHAAVFAGLSDVQAEATLLLTFIPREKAVTSGSGVMSAWRRGDADSLWHSVHDGYRDYPALGERLLEDRNRRWIPKIEGYIKSGQTYMVTVGAAHMGGPSGLVALLKARGFRVEQL